MKKGGHCHEKRAALSVRKPDIFTRQDEREEESSTGDEWEASKVVCRALHGKSRDDISGSIGAFERKKVVYIPRRNCDEESGGQGVRELELQVDVWKHDSNDSISPTSGEADQECAEDSESMSARWDGWILFEW